MNKLSHVLLDGRRAGRAILRFHGYTSPSQAGRRGPVPAGALVFTARNFTESRRTFKLTERGQMTDRYTKAIEQLGSSATCRSCATWAFPFVSRR